MSRKILIVEDEPSIADNLKYALGAEGFEPSWVVTAQEALALLENGQYALILLDVGLPDMDGFELARRIRKSFDTPILFLTARSSEIDRVVGLEIGADDYVVKPFSVRELSARIKAILRRMSKNEVVSSPTKCHADFSLDQDKYLIRYRGVALELSRYEYRLLSVLICRPGRVFTREQLMQKAWQEPEMSLERTVDTHVKTLRHKLKSAGAPDDLICTHRGIGYSLRESA